MVGERANFRKCGVLNVDGEADRIVVQKEPWLLSGRRCGSRYLQKPPYILEYMKGASCVELAGRLILMG